MTDPLDSATDAEIGEAFVHSEAVKRFTEEQRCGRNTGNYHLTTSAGFRLAVSSFDPATVKKYLTVEMGIGAEVVADADGLAIGFGKYAHHSHATVTRDLQGSFRMMSLTHEDGRQVIKVLGYKSEDAPALVRAARAQKASTV